ncbi:uncharacterized protein LOC100572057 [Acyrthosiphon pisum]|uniref:Uncharacterized protein n=1 Tax=Acyrthosiphon pisum TaxID=7029 RepID=A0A8R1W3Z5_ACYPI|nr:uncharacterized protein LOC100572057 [Acyrthosiphon pisum]|eukprot:XP_003240625.1 PREDICTED: uncharacterized protein LOC100572057 [Acyrthosiphon pisum]
MMNTEILKIGFIVLILWLVIRLFIKQDNCEGVSAKQPSVPVNFQRLTTLDQLKLLLYKLEELEQQNLSPCKTKLVSVAERLKKMNIFQIKSELLYKDELMQYERAIDWIKSPAEFRNRCGPPNLFSAYSPMTDSDIKRLAELTLPPVDITKTPVEPSRWSVASGESSLPVVDQWLANTVCLLIEFLDMALNFKDMVCSWVYNDHFTEHGGLVKFLCHAIVVTAEEDTEADKTIFTLDFMVPSSVTLDSLPKSNAIGIPIKPRKGFCCFPVKYTESNA